MKTRIWHRNDLDINFENNSAFSNEKRILSKKEKYQTLPMDEQLRRQKGYLYNLKNNSSNQGLMQERAAVQLREKTSIISTTDINYIVGTPCQ